MEIEDEENEAEGFDTIEHNANNEEKPKKSKKKSDTNSIELDDLK